MKDYSKTEIYYIKCKNELIKDTYVGVSIDFKNRRHVHKYDCESGDKNHIQLYKFIVHTKHIKIVPERTEIPRTRITLNSLSLR